MKITLNILSAILFIFQGNLCAQDIQKWYADDIYFNASEKEISYIEIEYYSSDEFHNEDQYNDDYQNEENQDEMSFSMRINRFHRDSYGNFQNPYFYSGINSGMFGMDPFFNAGNMWSYNNWYSPYYSYSVYNPWLTGSFYNPYGFGMGYGYGVGYGYGMGYGFGMGINSFANNQDIHYGPRNNVSGKNNATSRGMRNGKKIIRNQLNTNIETSQKKSLINLIRNGGVNNSTINFNEARVVPSRFDYSNDTSSSDNNKSDIKSKKSSSIKRSQSPRKNRNISFQRNTSPTKSGGSRSGRSAGRPR